MVKLILKTPETNPIITHNNMPRRYPAGGSYRGQYNSYQQQPTAQQYESFYKPIPLDFLQNQLDRRQGKYDTAFAGSIAAKEQMAAQQVGMRDIAGKNEIISNTMSNIDKVVEEKYGGDWGRASKEIASMVSSARQNPFWNAQAEVEKKRASYQSQVDKFGANALRFGADPRQTSTLDEQGRVRNQDQFSGEVVEKGDYLKTATTLMSGLTADQVASFDIDPAEYVGWTKGETVSKVTLKKIRAMADSPEMQELFLSQHGEIRRAGELSQDQQEQFGFAGKTPEEFASAALFGAARSAVHKKQTLDVKANPYTLADYKARLSGTAANPYIPSTSDLAVTSNSTEALDNHRNMVEQGGMAVHKADDGLGGSLGYVANPIADGEEKAAFEAKQEASKNEYWGTLKEQHPELQGMTRDGAFKVMDDYYLNESKKIRIANNLHLEDSGTNLTNNLLSNIGVGNFEALTIQNASGDISGTRNIVDALGYADHTEMVETIRKLKIAPRIDFSQGKIVVDIPSTTKQKGLFKGRKEGSTSLYYSPDHQTQDVLDVGQAASQMYNDPQNYGTPVIPGEPLQFGREGDGGTTVNGSPLLYIPNGRGGYTGDAIFIQGAGSVIGKTNKTIYVIDTENPTGEPRVISQETLNNMLAEQVDTRWNNYEGLSGNPGKEK